MESNRYSVLLTTLFELGYKEAFTLIDGFLYSDTYPDWSCPISKVLDPINVTPFPDNRVSLYAVTCPGELKGTFILELPSGDDEC